MAPGQKQKLQRPNIITSHLRVATTPVSSWLVGCQVRAITLSSVHGLYGSRSHWAFGVPCRLPLAAHVINGHGAAARRLPAPWQDVLRATCRRGTGSTKRLVGRRVSQNGWPRFCCSKRQDEGATCWVYWGRGLPGLNNYFSKLAGGWGVGGGGMAVPEAPNP